MALSPNYGWSEPDNSSLVKNGAADIRTLGDSIDTSVWNIGFGQAGKNKLINGDFRINQRNFTSNTTTGTYNFDRWAQLNTGGTFTVTPQTFTPGAAPVAGYEGSTYLQGISAGQSAASDNARFRQKIESVRTLAGSTATISFWAKAASGTPKIGIEIAQEFGTGGGPSAFNSVPVSAVTISTSWVRYTATIAVPSLSGKTIGTDKDDCLQLLLWVSAGSDFATRASSIGIQNNTFQIWGVQVEAGSTATAFQTATGTLQGELAACQRYYIRYSSNGDSNFDLIGPFGSAAGTTQAFISWNTPTMRIAASAVDYANLRLADNSGGTPAISNLVLIVNSNPTTQIIEVTTSGATAYRPYLLQANNNATAYIGFSAEL